MAEFEVVVDFESGEIDVVVDFPNLIYNPSTGGNVTITDLITSSVIATVAAPGNYDVLVFSGIHGGASNTTFTNSIVGT